jgi:hypothetical protein
VFTATCRLILVSQFLNIQNNTALLLSCAGINNNVIDQLNNGSGLDIEQITSTIYTQAEVNSFFYRQKKCHQLLVAFNSDSYLIVLKLKIDK